MHIDIRHVRNLGVGASFYRPEYTGKGFKTIITAREWGLSFVNWYNNHRHSKINFVTPVQRHKGLDKDILCKRKDVFKLAKKQHPERWSGETRKWKYQTEVWLNPVRFDSVDNEELVESVA